ncbi:hypothetical protein ETU10_06280 [Apibacter muscae]|uniref:VanW family protein n=1 Tax=Apibacter muscae TaxID=2509004 RepID=UPI0011AC0C41|nr:VanW family protein [Apibacter muscae]TWP23836.1 hypothetical protein ETU10_06280 [Apibacter muscae]
MKDHDAVALAQKHSWYKTFLFYVKTNLWCLKRNFQNKFHRIKKFPVGNQFKNLPVVSISKSDLWTNNEKKEHRILTAGKIHNLRIASRKINGLEIPAGETFSFWKYIGKPLKSRGFVVGREIREGCLLPTIGGGLCQLSNALYDAAIKANFKILERHRHSLVVEGSLAEVDRDATVKWNYIDLRFLSTQSFRIEVEMTSEKLIVTIKSYNKVNNVRRDIEDNNYLKTSIINDCYTCGNQVCILNNPKINIKNISKTTYVVDEYSPEYENYINNYSEDNSTIILPFFKRQKIKNDNKSWTIHKGEVITYSIIEIYQCIKYKFKKGNIFKLSFEKNRGGLKKLKS